MTQNDKKTHRLLNKSNGIALLILLVIVTIVGLMVANKPEARKRPQRETVESVEVMPLTLENYPVFVDSFGNIQASTSGNLVAQVSGVVTEVSPQFASGNAFAKGDVLLQIDPSDFEIDVKIAQADVVNAQLAVQEEQARAEQARLDWQKINPNKTASDLVLRKPQVSAAKAKFASAQARLEKAQLALKRTQVVAPYDGYIIDKKSDIGQLVSANSPVASIFSSDSLEVRLPVPSNKVEFLKMLNAEQAPAMVKLTVTMGQNTKDFLAELTRTHSVIDEQTRQWFVTANLPAQLLNDEPWLKVGQFVRAEIEGTVLRDVFVIPSKLIAQDRTVFIYRDGRLYRRGVEVLWQKDDMSVINSREKSGDSALQEGDLLVTTMLSFVADGAKAQIKGKDGVRKKKPMKNKNDANVGAES